MKFTKEEAFENLKGELTKGGKTLRMSDRTLNAHLETLMPLAATEETELSAFVSAILPAMQNVNSNMEHDMAEFTKNYKPNTPPATPPVPPVTPPSGGKTELEKRLEALEQRLAEEEKTKKIKAVQGNLIKTMIGKGVDENWAKSFVKEISISEDMDIETKATSFLEIYNKANADVPFSATPLGSGGASSKVPKDMWNDLKPKEDK